MHAINGWGFFGMHLFWWLFWVLVITGFATTFTPVPKHEARRRGTALDVLQRRYASGEISTDEYDQRRSVLVRDGAATV